MSVGTVRVILVTEWQLVQLYGYSVVAMDDAAKVAHCPWACSVATMVYFGVSLYELLVLFRMHLVVVAL